MNPIHLAEIAMTKPVVAGIAIAAFLGIYLAFKVAKFVMKLLLVVAVLALIGLAVWFYFSAHHVAP
jgi:hypothetical protein